MIIRSEELKKICSKILMAVDSNSTSIFIETLSLYTSGKYLYLALTNREYFVKVRLNIQEEVEFNATVSAELFLKLISKITFETVEFIIKDNFLLVKSNGSYRLPMIYDGDKLLELPEINIDNVTSTFNVDSAILSSISNYNSRELAKKAVTASPVQKMYYIDNKGCITFTSGACVNKFTLPTTVKFLLNDKIVKLFKLFTEESVNVNYGNDTLSNGVVQSKIKLKTDSVELTAIINSDENMINSVPESAIRQRAFDNYNYSVVINKKSILDAVDRILLFSETPLSSYGKLIFNKDKVCLSNEREDNSESIYYENNLENDIDYTAIFDLTDLRLIISGVKSDYITLNFGNGQAAVLIENNIYNIIPECII